MRTSNIIIGTAIVLLFSIYAFSFFTLGTQSKEHEVTQAINDNLEEGYSQHWAEHKALVELNIIPADSLYVAIEED